MSTNENNQSARRTESSSVGKILIDSEIGSVIMESEMDCGSTIVPKTTELRADATYGPQSQLQPVSVKPHGAGLPNLKAGNSSMVRESNDIDETNSRSSKRKRDEDILEEAGRIDDQNSKKNKAIDDQPSTKVMLVSRIRELTLDDLEELLRNLYPRHDKLLTKSSVPRFNGRGLNSGRIWFDCVDVEGRKWLEKQVKSITDSWTRGTLDVTDWVAAPPLNRILVSVPWLKNERSSAHQVISRLDGLNPALGINRWRLFKAAKPWEGKRLFIFGLDYESLSLLEGESYSLFYSFGKITAFQYTGKPAKQ